MVYITWQVGDVIRLCAKVSDVCPQSGNNFLEINSTDIQKDPAGCNTPCLPSGCASRCISIYNKRVRALALRHYTSNLNDVYCPNLRADYIYGELGNITTDSNGYATISHTVTESDRQNYLNAINNGKTYDIAFCIDDAAASSGGYTRVNFGITITNPCAGITCNPACYYNPTTGHYDYYSRKCDPNTLSCIKDTLIESHSSNCIPEQHTLYFGVSRSFPAWFINNSSPLVQEAARLAIIGYSDYYIDGVYFDETTYVLSVVINKNPTSIATLIIPIIVVLAVIAIAIIAAVADWYYFWYMGSKSVTGLPTTQRTITVEPFICTTDVSTGNVDCEKPSIKIIIEYCIEKNCQTIEITDGNPKAFNVTSNVDIVVTVKADSPNYTIYKETVKQGTDAYTVTARLAPKASAKITPGGVDSSNQPISCGYYSVTEKASDGSDVEISRGTLDPTTGKAPQLTIKSDVETCVQIVPCDLTTYKFEKTCYKPNAGDVIDTPTIIKNCNEAKNAVSVRTVYIASDNSINSFTADSIEIRSTQPTITITPTSDITYKDGLSPNITYTVHIIKSGYTIRNNDQTVQFSTNCFTTKNILVETDAPVNMKDVAIKVVSPPPACPSGSVVEGASVILDSGEAKKTDVTGIVQYPAIPQGNHDIKITYGGYKDESFTINVTTSTSFSTPFIKCLTANASVGTADTRISEFNGSGTMNVGNAIKFSGTLEYKDPTTGNWGKLTDADITVTIKEDSNILKTFSVTTQSGILSSGYFETPQWLLTSNLMNKNIDANATFAGIGDYKPSSVSQTFFIGESCIIPIPFTNTCLLSQGTARTIVLVGGVLIGGYVLYKLAGGIKSREKVIREAPERSSPYQLSPPYTGGQIVEIRPVRQ